ncbi:MAG: putative transposase [Candidatus Peregrinibacteria bacterium Greene0416_19]|nr:MAG: putative transposase [Candidatus Peregrinibacteria bacterium Greene0416_19]
MAKDNGMSQRHPTQNDCVMFVTTNVARRLPLFADPACAREAVETLYRVQAMYPFFLFGFVIMPDHCHLLLKVPPPAEISSIIGSYKRAVSHNLVRGPIWQPRFHMKIPGDCYAALRYIHLNSVRAKLTENPEEYLWSSASGRWDVQSLEGP